MLVYGNYLLYLQVKKHSTMKNKVYHIEFKQPPREGRRRHFYFGSKVAIYSMFGKEDIGITYQYMLNLTITEDEPYENSKCIIRLGELHRKQTERAKAVIAPQLRKAAVRWKSEEEQ